MALLRSIIRSLPVLAIAVLVTTAAEEHLSTLKVGREVYTNVTVTKVTAVDVSFLHARGMGNAKLKDLEPELQKHFHYDPVKAGAAQQLQNQANAEYRQAAITNKPVHPPNMDRELEPAPTAKQAHDRSAYGPGVDSRGRPCEYAPPLVVEKWIKGPPQTDGKFVLIEFWATWCPHCCDAIPKLNTFQSNFGSRLEVIGISDEPEMTVRTLIGPIIRYSSAIDPKGRLKSYYHVNGIPSSVLIDPDGIIRYRGNPLHLTPERLSDLIASYGK